MENETWIKLYRKLLQSPIFENEKALKVWIWCLLKATHVEREQLVGKTIIHLEKGQFVFGRTKASEELKMTESTVYIYIKLLSKLNMISINSNNKFSVISVEKWEDYQGEVLKSNNKETTKEQQSNTNKNVNNIYLYFINKYKGDEKNKFRDSMKIIHEMREDEKWDMLSAEEQFNLISEI